MSANNRAKENRVFLGVDIGGTKILASLVDQSGSILQRERSPTPRDRGSKEVVAAIEQLIERVVKKHGLELDELAAIGLAVPGVVDPDAGLVVVTPNMSLSGVSLGPHLEDRFKVPVAMGNDCNLGALGETWLGSARHASSAIAILVGTGIGSGVVQEGKLWRGARESGGEIGHIVMQIGGPQCGCGNNGCLEALASRSAIERDLRAAIDAGRKSVLPELLEDDLSIIRSSALRRALEAKDKLVTEVMGHASEVLGHACLTVRHLVDPEVIVLGGGVVEACSDFILPIVEGIIDSDQLPGAREGGRVLLAGLGDDAVVFGAVALAGTHIGRNPFEKQYAPIPSYPEISGVQFGQITVGKNTHTQDIVIRVDGTVKKRKKATAKNQYGSSHTLGPKELGKVCRGGPEVVFVGTGQSGLLELTEDARRYLRRRSIECEALSTPEIGDAYNDCGRRKVALIHLTC